MIKFYRIKNAETGEYFKRSGCIINSCSEEDAPGQKNSIVIKSLNVELSHTLLQD